MPSRRLRSRRDFGPCTSTRSTTSPTPCASTNGADTSASRATTTTRRRRSSCEKPSQGRRPPKRGEISVPLQNRVMPTGEIVALPGRGLVMGNRGVLHDERRRIVRATQVKRWIACRIAFRGRHRTVMTPRSWTELFFLDEATAFAAGHRPCAECRNADYKRFRALWEACFGGPAGADAIDAVLHAERRDGRAKRTWRSDVAALPDGAYVSIDGVPRIVWDGELVAW